MTDTDVDTLMTYTDVDTLMTYTDVDTLMTDTLMTEDDEADEDEPGREGHHVDSPLGFSPSGRPAVKDERV